MAKIYARLLNENKFKYQRVFFAGFDQEDEGDQVLDEPEFYINLDTNRSLSESDINNTHIRSQLENQQQNQETRDSGWRIDKISS